MIVHLRGAGFSNKGAELMLLSAVRWLRHHYPDSLPALSHSVGESRQRRGLGLRDVVWVEHHRLPAVKRALNLLVRLNARRRPLPDGDLESARGGGAVNGAAHRHGVTLRHARAGAAVTGRDVDVVLDLSGFAYGDPWGPREAVIAATYYREIRSRGGRVILMPQQLGPFDRADVREAFRNLSLHCDLIFARDALSYGAASAVMEKASVLQQAPDFTILQAGTAPVDHRYACHACIVPNFKMVQQRPEEERRAYPEFLRRCVEALRARGTPAFVLLHEYSGRDEQIAKKLSDVVGGIDIVREADPLKLKGIIGASHITVGSRFHGLVSALSQGVPSLATSWSHKYELLFSEYGCEECLVKPMLTDEELDAALARVLEQPSRGRIVDTLRARNELQKQKAAAMWHEVGRMISSVMEPRTTAQRGASR